MKECNKCKEVKELTEFHFRKDQDKYRLDCKVCRRTLGNAYSIEVGRNRLIQEKRRDLTAKGLRHCKRCCKTMSRDNFSNQSDKSDGKKSRCKACDSEISKNCPKRKKTQDEYYQRNSEDIIEKHRQYRKIPRVKEMYNSRDKERKSNDPLYKLTCVLKSRTSKAFKRMGYKKKTKTQQMLGVSYEVVKAHIERQFKNGMTWNNNTKEGWHVDHIIPLASAKNEEELRKLCHYTNLQPLWSFDNISKGANIIDGTQVKLRI